MRELSDSEIAATHGAGIIRETFDDIYYVVKRLPALYDTAISSTADMMCRATGKC